MVLSSLLFVFVIPYSFSWVLSPSTSTRIVLARCRLSSSLSINENDRELGGLYQPSPGDLLLDNFWELSSSSSSSVDQIMAYFLDNNNLKEIEKERDCEKPRQSNQGGIVRLCKQQKMINNNEDENEYDHLFNVLYQTNNNTSTNVSFSSSYNKKDRDTKFSSYKITVSYNGEHFCGWQQQLNSSKPSVQETLISILDPYLNPTSIISTSSPFANNNTRKVSSKKINNRKKKKKKTIDIRVSGRTDSGVHAIGQVCRVRTFRDFDLLKKDMILYDEKEEMKNIINNHPLSISSSSLRKKQILKCQKVEKVTSLFHPTFCSTSRAYVYVLDTQPFLSSSNDDQNKNLILQNVCEEINKVLNPLEHKELDYFALSHGKVKTQNTTCTLTHARAFMVDITQDQYQDQPSSSSSPSFPPVILIQLVGNRFLRRMVRILVSTVIREVLVSKKFQHDSNPNNNNISMMNQQQQHKIMDLEDILESQSRMYSAKAAPPNRLIFVGCELDQDYFIADS